MHDDVATLSGVTWLTHFKSTALLLALLALPTAGQAQTKTVYPASTVVVTMNFTGGGNATLNPVLGPNCYLGQRCDFPAGYAGTDMSYILPDGTSAYLPNFHGAFFPVGNAYELEGKASGKNNAGHRVVVNNVKATMTITCQRGCTKTYTGGTMTLTVY